MRVAGSWDVILQADDAVEDIAHEDHRPERERAQAMLGRQRIAAMVLRDVVEVMRHQQALERQLLLAAVIDRNEIDLGEARQRAQHFAEPGRAALRKAGDEDVMAVARQRIDRERAQQCGGVESERRQHANCFIVIVVAPGGDQNRTLESGQRPCDQRPQRIKPQRPDK